MLKHKGFAVLETAAAVAVLMIFAGYANEHLHGNPHFKQYDSAALSISF